jgi:hypothetical protein
LGWILVAWLLAFFFGWDSPDGRGNGMLKNTFLMAGAASAVLGLFSFTLPATPPKVKREKVSTRVSDILGLDAT